MYATRIPAIINNKIQFTPEMTKEQMNAKIPRSTQWKAENYDHLHEQPTYFLAIILALVHLGARDRLTVGLAWAYVGLRVVHSLEQAVTNVVIRRFRIFVLSSFALLGLTVKAGSMVI